MIRFACSKCGQEIEESPRNAGLLVKCPHCAGRIRVPENDPLPSNPSLGLKPSGEPLPGEEVTLTAPPLEFGPPAPPPLPQHEPNPPVPPPVPPTPPAIKPSPLNPASTEGPAVSLSIELPPSPASGSEPANASPPPLQQASESGPPPLPTQPELPPSGKKPGWGTFLYTLAGCFVGALVLGGFGAALWFLDPLQEKQAQLEESPRTQAPNDPASQKQEQDVELEPPHSKDAAPDPEPEPLPIEKPEPAWTMLAKAASMDWEVDRNQCVESLEQCVLKLEEIETTHQSELDQVKESAIEVFRKLYEKAEIRSELYGNSFSESAYHQLETEVDEAKREIWKQLLPQVKQHFAGSGASVLNDLEYRNGRYYLESSLSQDLTHVLIRAQFQTYPDRSQTNYYFFENWKPDSRLSFQINQNPAGQKSDHLLRVRLEIFSEEKSWDGWVTHETNVRYAIERIDQHLRTFQFTEAASLCSYAQKILGTAEQEEFRAAARRISTLQKSYQGLVNSLQPESVFAVQWSDGSRSGEFLWKIIEFDQQAHLISGQFQILNRPAYSKAANGKLAVDTEQAKFTLQLDTGQDGISIKLPAVLSSLHFLSKQDTRNLSLIWDDSRFIQNNQAEVRITLRSNTSLEELQTRREEQFKQASPKFLSRTSAVPGHEVGESGKPLQVEHEVEEILSSADGEAVLVGTKHQLSCWRARSPEKPTWTENYLVRAHPACRHLSRLPGDPQTVLIYGEGPSGVGLQRVDLATGKISSTLVQYKRDDVFRFVISPDQKRLVIGTFNGPAIFWHLNPISGGEPEKKYCTFSNSPVTALAFRPQGNFFAAADSTIRMGSQLGQIVEDTKYTKHSGPVWPILVGPRGDRILSISGVPGGTISLHIWAYPSLQLEYSSTFGNKVEMFDVSPDWRFMLVAEANHDLELWSLPEDRKVTTFQGHSKQVTTISFSENGRYVFSGSKDQTVRRWGLPTETSQQ